MKLHVDKDENVSTARAMLQGSDQQEEHRPENQRGASYHNRYMNSGTVAEALTLVLQYWLCYETESGVNGNYDRPSQDQSMEELPTGWATSVVQRSRLAC